MPDIDPLDRARLTALFTQFIDHFDGTVQQNSTVRQVEAFLGNVLRERDDLVGQVARLTETFEAELDAVMTTLREERTAKYKAEADVITLRGEVARLTQALGRYGRHDEIVCWGNYKGNPCNCGLDAALRGATEEHP